MTAYAFTHLALPFVVISPAVGVLLLGTRMAVARPLSERFTTRVALSATALGWVSMVALAILFTQGGKQPIDARYGAWFEVGNYELRVSLLADKLSIAMLLVSGTITMLVARFSVRYLHREPGFHRFFLLLLVFASGMNLLVLAGSYDLLFAGWELVGVASMLLIAFFDHRRGPVRGAVRAMVTYRVADVGLLVAGAMLHEMMGSASFADAFGARAWPHATSALPASGSTLVALALLLATMGKSAQFPLGGWLSRAMEGPTPSSALFYGALSVHAGVYLLLRSAPLLEASPLASAAVTCTGALTAIYATFVGRTQSDVKNGLAYATMTQVGLMLVGTGLHFFTWVIVHMIAHACLRLLQLLRTPSALRDALEMRAALRQVPKLRPSPAVHFLPRGALDRIYHLARQRFFVDDLLNRTGEQLAELSSAAGRRPGRVLIGVVAAHALVMLGTRVVAPPTALATGVDSGALSLVTIASSLYVAFAGLSQHTLPRALCFVIASQTGVALFGIIRPESASVQGAVLQLVSVSLAGAGLFVIARALAARTKTMDLVRLTGQGRRFRGMAAAFFLLSAATIGLPGSLAFVGEDLLLHGLLHENPLGATLLLFVTVLNGITLLKLFFQVFQGPELTMSLCRSAGDLSPSERVILATLIIAMFASGLMPAPLLALEEHALGRHSTKDLVTHMPASHCTQ